MARWDGKRFLETLNYFEAIPIFSQLQRGWHRHGAENSQQRRMALGTILVAGETTDLARSTVELLGQSGYNVRAIGRAEDVSQWPAGVERAIVDLNNPLTLTTAVMTGVTGLIIIGAIEPLALDNLLKAAADYLPNPTERSIFDFSQPNANTRDLWGAIDDVVMGGVSQSGIQITDRFARFSGYVSTENSGGFASIRTKNFDPPLDLSNYQGLKLRVKGDGQRYKLFLRTETAWDGVGYARSFDSSSYDWLDLTIPFRDLIPIFRAKTVVAPAIDLDRLRSIQVMLSKFEYDGNLNPYFQAGNFTLDIQSIVAYGSNPVCQLAFITDRSSVLPVTQIPHQRVNDDDSRAANLAVRCLNG
jgi:hypothetical protein